MIVDPVNEDEVFERLRAALLKHGLTLHRGTLDGAAHDELGRFFTTVGTHGPVQDRHVDLQRWARREHVLGVNEAFVPAHGEVTE